MRTIAFSLIILSITFGCNFDQVRTAGHEARKPVVPPAKEKFYGGDYFIDDQHSYIGFRITYFGTSQVRGRFDKFKGTAFYDSSSNFLSVQIVVDASSINTGVALRDHDLRKESWLSTEKFPAITFKSSVVAAGKDGFDVTGELNFKNKKKAITATFTRPTKITKDWAGNDQVDFTGEFGIKRSDFGIAAGGTWDKIMENGFAQLSDEVKIEVEIHARRADYARRKKMLSQIDSSANLIMSKINEKGFEAGVMLINKLQSADKKNVSAFALHTVASILLFEKKQDEAIKVFEMKSVFYPEEKDVLNSLAICYLLKGDIDKAKLNFDEALRVDSTNTKALEYLRLLQ